MGGEAEGDSAVLPSDTDLSEQGTEKFRIEHNLHENDVICGKYAQRFGEHIGNIEFGKYLESRFDEYKRLGNDVDGKQQFVDSIMHYFRKKGVRFITVSDKYEVVKTGAKKKKLPNKWVLAEDKVVKIKIRGKMERLVIVDSMLDHQEGKMIEGMEKPEENPESNKKRKLATGEEITYNNDTGVGLTTTIEINKSTTTAGGSHTGIDFHNNRNLYYYPQSHSPPNWYQVKNGIKQDMLLRLSKDLQLENDRYCSLTAQVKTCGHRVHYLQNKIHSLQQDLIHDNTTGHTSSYVNQNYVVPTGPPVFGTNINNGIMVRPSIPQYVNGRPAWGTNTNTNCMTTSRLPIPPQTGIVPIQQEQQQEGKSNKFVHEQRQQQQQQKNHNQQQQQQMEQKRHQEQGTKLQQVQMQVQQKRQKEKTNQLVVEPRREQQQQKQKKYKNQELQQNEQERHHEHETMLRQRQEQPERQHSYSLSLTSHNNSVSTYYDNNILFDEVSTSGIVEETIIPTQITSTRIRRIENQQERQQQESNDNGPSVIEQLLEIEQQNRHSSSDDDGTTNCIPQNIMALLE